MTPDGQARADIERHITYQSYDEGDPIEGVAHRYLSTFADLDGSVTEVHRLSEGKLESPDHAIELRQLTVSRASPFRINAFHLHPRQRQDEVWTVLAGSLKVWLVDTRKNSSSTGVMRCYHLSGEPISSLFIPWGVAHGYQAGHQGALILYAMNAQFDRENPNEGRLPWDYFGSDLWSPDRG